MGRIRAAAIPVAVIALGAAAALLASGGTPGGAPAEGGERSPGAVLPAPTTITAALPPEITLPAGIPYAPLPAGSAAQPRIWPMSPAQLPRYQIPGEFRCPSRPILAPAAQPRHSFYFTRGAYSSDPFSFRGSAWATDFEKADRQFLIVIERVLPIDAFSCENPIRLDDPHLRRFPFLYMVEVGYMRLTPPEVTGLRDFLLQGGFLLVDDFWGSREWASFENEMRRVLPEHEIVEIPSDHIVFRTVYPVQEVLQVPSIGNARRGVYHEQDGFVPHMRGIFDEDGRLMVAIAWNTDMGDAWEWAEQPDYPWDRSNYALQMGINFILYAMTH